MNLIFVHGGPGLDEYLSEYFRNVKLDKGVLRFYQQLKGNSVTIEDLVSQLGEEIEAVGECTLVGHSWGGTLAIEYLKRTKDSRVKSLVLMNVPLSYDHWFEVYERHLLKHGLTEKPFEFIALADHERPSGINYIQRVMRTFDTETYNRIVDTYILKSLDLCPTISSLGISILNIYGGQDHRIPKEVGESIANLGSHIKSLYLSEMGHFGYVEKTNEK